jgi:hypothetical protein
MPPDVIRVDLPGKRQSFPETEIDARQEPGLALGAVCNRGVGGVGAMPSPVAEDFGDGDDRPAESADRHEV